MGTNQTTIPTKFCVHECPSQATDLDSARRGELVGRLNFDFSAQLVFAIYTENRNSSVSSNIKEGLSIKI